LKPNVSYNSTERGWASCVPSPEAWAEEHTKGAAIRRVLAHGHAERPCAQSGESGLGGNRGMKSTSAH